MSANKWTFTTLLGLTTLVTTATLFTSVPAQADVARSNQIQIEGKINLDSNAGIASINCSNVKIEVKQEEWKNGASARRKSDVFYKQLATTNGRSDCRYSISFDRSISAAALNLRIFATTQDPNLSGSSSLQNISLLQNNYTADLTLHR